MFTPLEVLQRHGFTGTLYAHSMQWFTVKPDPAHYHPMTEYNSNDRIVIGRKLELMKMSGVKGVIVTYQGNLSTYNDACCIETCQQCGEHQMSFLLCLDPNVAKSGPGTPQENAQAVLNSVSVATMLNDPAYDADGYILDFNLAATGCDVTKLVQPKMPNGSPRPAMLQLWKGFSWIKADGADPVAACAKANALPSMVIPAVGVSFNDGGLPNAGGKTPDPEGGCGPIDLGAINWGKGQGATRYVPDRAGNYFRDTATKNIDWSRFKKAALCTWDDYNERTGPWEPWCAIMNDFFITQ